MGLCEHIATRQDDVEFSSVTVIEEINYVWPEVVDLIERGLRHGQGDGTTSETLRHRVMTGDMLMWTVHKDSEVLGVVILSMNTHATGKKLFVEMLAGHNPEEWQDQLIDLLRDFRDITGAMCIEASCRKGMVKRLRALGWREKAVVMELG